MNRLCEVLHRFSLKYLLKFGESMPYGHRKALLNFEDCRTDTYGRLESVCHDCGTVEESNGACRNRACPKCNNSCTKSWIERRKARFPHTSYHHLVFTVPDELRYLARKNQKVFYTALMDAVSNTLIAFGSAPKWVNGKIGFLTVLHTWDTKLNIHPHVHVLLMGGYLNDGGVWVEINRKVMFPHSAMQVRYKTVLLKSLRDAFEEKIPSDFWKRPFVIYSKKAFPGDNNILEYLGQYIKRIGISPSRITHVDKHGVTFKYRQRVKGGPSEYREMTVSGEEFLRRYLQHVLPKGFIRVRYFGLLHPYFKDQLAGIADSIKPPPEMTVEEEPIQFKRCKECRLPMVTTFLLLPSFFGTRKKKGGEFYIKKDDDQDINGNNENITEPAYNKLIESTAVFPSRRLLTPSVAPDGGFPPALTPCDSSARYTHESKTIRKCVTSFFLLSVYSKRYLRIKTNYLTHIKTKY